MSSKIATARRVQSHEFDQRVTFQQRASGTDSLGQENGLWQTISTVWAKVTVLPGSSLRGDELLADAQTIGTQIKRVRIRYNPSVPLTWRLLHEGQPHDITSVSTLTRRDVTEIMCSAGVRDGR